ncbi:hypothetical protein BJX99DRAFT_223611 [Aspergillus californicus]
MAALQEALKCLNATPWDQVPTGNADLRAYITDMRAKARLIVDSVPEPPPQSSRTSTKDTVRSSNSRLGTTNESTLSNQKEWSKPIKVGNTRDNPVGIQVYKLPGADGQGLWFGRRTVHEGLPFSVWEDKLSREISETLRKNQRRMEEGLPPDQAVRGIGAQKRVEEIEIMDDTESMVVGRVNIYHVSATFPRPTTSRDFVTMIITWEKETEEGEGLEDETMGEKRAGRSWMMVSRPCVHPDVPEVQEYIRGQYESVEMVREILVKDESDKDAASGAEDNPVEWIMVTRSDPGGNIPRWMVEKGTPKSICADAAKFLDWACQDTTRDSKEQERARRSTSKSKTSRLGAFDESEDSSESDLSEYYQEEHHGLIATFGHLLTAGIERYAPQAVIDYMPPQPHSRQPTSQDLPDDASTHSSEPVEPVKDKKDDETMSQVSLASDVASESTTPGDINLDASTADILQRTKKGKLSSHEKQLAKLAQEKRSVEAQIEVVLADIQSLGLRPSGDDIRKEKAAALSSVDEKPRNESPTSSTQKFASDQTSNSGTSNRSRAETSSSETNTQNPEMSKVASALFREESKLLRRLGKIERHQLKEAAKIEAQQRKDAEKQDKARSKGQAETQKREIEHLRKENDKLKSERKKWLGLIGSLQAENTKLARQIGGTT